MRIVGLCAALIGVPLGLLCLVAGVSLVFAGLPGPGTSIATSGIWIAACGFASWYITRDTTRTPTPLGQSPWDACPDCDGTGRQSGLFCPTCGGCGRRY